MKNNYLLTVISIFITFYCTPTFAQFPFSDNFESGTLSTGLWNVSGNAQISTNAPANGTYCLEGPNTWGINRTFTANQIGILTVEFNAKADQTNTSCMIFRIKDIPGNTSVGIFFDAVGNINATDSTGHGSVVPVLQYLPNKWYFFRFEIDHATHHYDLYIDNTLLAQGFRFFSNQFVDPYLFTWSSVATSGTAWIDDIEIYTGTVGINKSSPNIPVKIYYDMLTSNISVNATNRVDEILIYNSMGQLLLNNSSPGEQCEFSISGFTDGVYLVDVVYESQHFTKRILKD